MGIKRRIQLPRYKTFLIKSDDRLNGQFIKDLIVRVNGQAVVVDNYAGFAGKLQESHYVRDSRQNLANLIGVIYTLKREGERIPSISSKSSLGGLMAQEDVVPYIRQIIGEAPLIVTYYRQGQDRISDLEQMFIQRGADSVLLHPFTENQFYQVLEETLRRKGR
ncbi:MAG: hypothetical protein ABIG89_00660 [Candidatus Woesearchaeota archaeon]